MMADTNRKIKSRKDQAAIDRAETIKAGLSAMRSDPAGRNWTPVAPMSPPPAALKRTKARLAAVARANDASTYNPDAHKIAYARERKGSGGKGGAQFDLTRRNTPSYIK